MQRLVLGCLVGALLGLSPPLHAQPNPLGGEFRVNTTTALDQENPQVAMDADGDFVVVWTDGAANSNGIDGSSRGIVAQRFDHDGNPLGGEILVNTDTAGAQQEPAVAMDADGNFVVVWTDTASFGGDGDGSGAGIAGQLFDSAGSPVGGEFAVNDQTADQQLRANVSMGPDGGFLVTWGDVVGQVNFELAARLFDANANPLGGQFQVNTFTTGRQYRAEAGFESNGDFVVAWRSYSPSGYENYDIKARRYDSAGNPLTGELLVNTYTTGSQENVDLAVAETGEFVVVWNSGGLDGSSGAIAGQRFDVGGVPVGGEFVVNTYTTSTQFRPTIAMDSHGRFTVSWVSFGQDGDRRGVFGQQFDAAGNTVGSEFQVNTYTLAEQGYGFRGPDIAMDDDGDTVVVWTDDGNLVTGPNGQDGSFAGVYAQRYEGSPVVDPSLVAFAPFDEGSGSITDFGDGQSGDLVGGVSWTQGQQGTALELDGTSGYVDLLDPGPSPLDLTDTLTITLWFRPDALENRTQTLLSKDNAYELEFGREGADVYELRIDNGGVGHGGSALTEGRWQHLAVTWDGATVRYYLNGQPDGSHPYAAMVDANNNNIGIGARPSQTGSGGGPPDFFFEGAIDDVRVYNRVLGDTEVADIFNTTVTDILPPVRSNAAPDGVVAAAPVAIGLDTDETAQCKFGETSDTRYADLVSLFTNTGGLTHDDSLSPAGTITDLSVRCRDPFGNTNITDFPIGLGLGVSDITSDLQGEWLFEEGSGCTTSDLINAQTGDLSNSSGTCDGADNSPQWQANQSAPVPGPCFSGSCLGFDGDDKVSVTVVDSLRVLPQELTVSVWVRHDPVLGTFSNLVDLRGTDVDSGLQALGFALALDDTGKGYFRVRGTTVVGSNDLDDGQWHHLVGVWRVGSVGTGSTRLYIDGVLDKAKNEGSATFNLAPSTQLQIGHRFNANETLHNHKGLIDTVSLYDRTLSDLEVFDLYLATRP